MESKIEPRQNFYSNEINYERMESKLEDVARTLTLAEVLKMIREISWDMVYYNDKENCGIIYKDNKYTEQNRWEACQLQSFLRTACDLFGQSVINKRVFEDGYLKKWLDGGAMELEIENLKKRIEQLEDELAYERSRNDT